MVRGNADGSLKLAQPRVLTASSMVSALMRISLAWLVGFMGLVSMLKGAKGAVHAAHVYEEHVGSDAHRAHEILAEAGPDAAIVLVRCEDQDMRQMVSSTASDNAKGSWDGPLTELLAALDPAALTTGCAPLSANPPARTARPTGS